MLFEVRDGREKSVVDVEDPSVPPVPLQAAARAEVHRAFLGRPLRVDPVLSRLHVLADVAGALFRDGLELPDVVELDVHPPGLTVVLEADADAPIPSRCSLAQDVPVCRRGGAHSDDDEEAQEEDHPAVRGACSSHATDTDFRIRGNPCCVGLFIYIERELYLAIEDRKFRLWSLKFRFLLTPWADGLLSYAIIRRVYFSILDR